MAKTRTKKQPSTAALADNMLARLKLADQALRLLREGDLNFLRDFLFGATFSVRTITECAAFEREIAADGELAPLMSASSPSGCVTSAFQDGRPEFYIFRDEEASETCNDLLGQVLASASALTYAAIGLDMRGVLDLSARPDGEDTA